LLKFSTTLFLEEEVLEERMVPQENEDLHDSLTRAHNFGKACQVDRRNMKKASTKDNTQQLQTKG
jgi:hypothetical protein